MDLPPVLIPAAGEGTRLRDVTYDQPKPLVPVAGKPVISWITEGLLQQGFTDFTYVVPHSVDRDPIAAYITDVYGKLIAPRFVMQRRKLGPLHAAREALRHMASPAVLLVLSDTVLFEPLATKDFTESWVYVAPVDDFHRWCFVEEDSGKVEAFYDKPDVRVPTNLALVGVYYLHDRQFLLSCADGVCHARRKIWGEYQLSTALDAYRSRYPLRVFQTEEWYDCGSIDNLRVADDVLLARRGRAFNELSKPPQKGTVLKSSRDPLGSTVLRDEADFYKSIPADLAVHFPRRLNGSADSGVVSLSLEYWPLRSLGDLLVYSRHSELLWLDIAQQLGSILAMFRSAMSDEIDLTDSTREMLKDKTLSRVESLRRQGFRLAEIEALRINGKEVPGWPAIQERLWQRIEEISHRYVPAFMHGDLCFSNILADIRHGVVKLVDPRGRYGSLPGVFGDQRYDLAKLRHSYHGGYDFIVNGLYSLDRRGHHEFDYVIARRSSHDDVERIFDSVIMSDAKRSLREVELIEGLLFISMCALHYEDISRQEALWLRGLEILAADIT